MTLPNLLAFCTILASTTVLIVTSIDTSSTTNVLLLVIAVSSIVGTISAVATHFLWRQQYREMVELVLTLQKRVAKAEGADIDGTVDGEEIK